MNILIIEDNKILSNNIKDYLKLEWIDSYQVFDFEKIHYELVNKNYDLIILDIWLGIEKNWFDYCKEIRERWNNIPILILTARNDINNKSIWFKSWADDYLTKPFDYEELLLRINALVRRNYSNKSNKININWEIDIDIENKYVSLKWEEIHLSKIEFKLLTYLSQNIWKVISKEELLEKVWNEYDDFKETRTVDVYIWYLRKKIDKDFIKTIRWEWYIINK